VSHPWCSALASGPGIAPEGIGSRVTALYYPDTDCTWTSRAIEHLSTVHDHHDTERAVVAAYRAWLAVSGDQWEQGNRYRCIRGPGGLVRGVVHGGMRLYAVRDGHEIWVPIQTRHLLTSYGPIPIEDES
jgi:hypothetical protein